MYSFSLVQESLLQDGEPPGGSDGRGMGESLVS